MGEEEPRDEAAEAFDALRVEVAQLRSLIEGLPTPVEARPDYSPTLGAIAQSLAAIEGHPALRLTPEGFGRQLRQVAEAVQHQSRRELASAIQRLDAASSGLERRVAIQRVARRQLRALILTAAIGAVVGAGLWVSLSGPVARSLPASWYVPEKMAAATLRLPRWEAGSRLMWSANPQAWAQLAGAPKASRPTNSDSAHDTRDVDLRRGKRGRGGEP
jgi:uncharacterized protein DUF6118